MILELVGAPNLSENLDSLAIGGRICIIGVGAGAKTEIDLRKLMGKRGRIHGSTLRNRPIEEKALAARLVEKMVLPGFASGDLAVPVTQTFALGGRAGRLRALPGRAGSSARSSWRRSPANGSIEGRVRSRGDDTLA